MSKGTKHVTNKKVRKTSRRKKKKPIALRILMGFVVIAVIIAAAGYIILNNMVGKFDGFKLNKDNLGVTSSEELSQYKGFNKILNIALFGVDSTDGAATGRSDSTMVATLDPVHNKLKITSFMRDSYVQIDGYGQDKLNHAYAYGGPELSIKTLNQNFGLNIQEFVSVDFSTLPVIIDLLGGIDLDITAEETEYINFYINELNKLNGTSSANIYTPGTQHVDGTQALAYSRIRYTSGGDYERTHRQRIVLTELFNKALALPSSQYLSIINQISPYVQTSLSTSDFLSLGTKMATMGLSGINLEQERFPLDSYSEGANIDGIYYLTFDEITTKEQVKNYIFNDVLPTEADGTTSTYDD